MITSLLHRVFGPNTGGRLDRWEFLISVIGCAIVAADVARAIVLSDMAAFPADVLLVTALVSRFYAPLGSIVIAAAAATLAALLGQPVLHNWAIAEKILLSVAVATGGRKAYSRQHCWASRSISAACWCSAVRHWR